MKRERYLSIYKAAENFFRSRHEGDEYMKKRGISKETADEFGIGAAPAKGFEFVQEMQRQGISGWELQEAGLLNSAGKAMFFNRLMFPLKDEEGNTIGFSGRIMGDGEPKYLNTGETEYFKKGDVLFNYSQAKLENKPFIICEGQMDVIAMCQAGFKNTVAAMGTAITDRQKEMLGRNGTITLCLDGDRAGTEKAIKNAMDLYPKPVNIVRLPGGHDPDEILRAEGAEGLKKHLHGYTLPQAYAIIMKEKFKTPEDANSVLRPKASHADYSKRAEIVLDRRIDVAQAVIPVLKKYSLDHRKDVEFLSDMTGFSPKDISMELSRTNERLRF